MLLYVCFILVIFVICLSVNLVIVNKKLKHLEESIKRIKGSCEVSPIVSIEESGDAENKTKNSLDSIALNKAMIFFIGTLEEADLLAKSLYNKYVSSASYLGGTYFTCPDEEIANYKCNHLFVVSSDSHKYSDDAAVEMSVSKDFATRRKASVGKIVCVLPQLLNDALSSILTKHADVVLTKDHVMYKTHVG